MNKHTPLYSVVTILIVVGYTLTALPGSVFSQTSAVDIVDGGEAVVVDTPEDGSNTETAGDDVGETKVLEALPTTAAALEDPYRREELIGDRVYNDFVVGPGKFELEIAPGETQVVELLVSNRLAEARVFSITTEDATAGVDADTTVQLLGDETGPYTLKDYISVAENQFLLQPNTRARIPVIVSLPDNAEPGGRYGSLLVSVVTQPAERREDGTAIPGSAVVNRIGSLFFITTPGELDRSGQLQDFATVNDQKFFSGGPIPFNLAFENTGTVHLTPSGKVEISNLLGEVIGESEVLPWFVLPQSVRNREIVWNREFLLGRYTAQVTVDRGYDGLVDQMEYSFWVLPWQFIITVFTGLFVIFLLLRFIFSRFEFKRK